MQDEIVSKDERLKVGERRVKNKLKASCQDLRPGVVQLINCFLERKPRVGKHSTHSGRALENCQGI